MAATGPSLTKEVAEACRWQKIIAVNDAYRLIPFADALYACDAPWWDAHEGVKGFAGEKWSSHGFDNKNNNKLECAGKWGLNLVYGQHGSGFSKSPERINYGGSSGFQAINLALLFGASVIILVGFNGQVAKKTAKNGKEVTRRHFFGDHPAPLNNSTDFKNHAAAIDEASRTVPDGVRIINATPKTALRNYERMELADALRI